MKYIYKDNFWHCISGNNAISLGQLEYSKYKNTKDNKLDTTASISIRLLNLLEYIFVFQNLDAKFHFNCKASEIWKYPICRWVIQNKKVFWLLLLCWYGNIIYGVLCHSTNLDNNHETFRMNCIDILVACYQQFIKFLSRSRWLFLFLLLRFWWSKHFESCTGKKKFSTCINSSEANIYRPYL